MQRVVRLVRLLAATGLVLVGVVPALSPVAAAGGCTQAVGTIADVLAERPTIVVGRPIARRFGGAAYDLMVETVVVGNGRVGRWSFGPITDPRPFQECRQPVVIPNGERVLMVIWRPATGTYPAQAWWEMPKTRHFPPVLFLDQTATTLPELIAEIRAQATVTRPKAASSLTPARIGPELPGQVWLDRPLPTDAAPGTPIHVGFTMWDPSQRAIIPAGSLSLYWRPATRDTAPADGVSVADWPGHAIADLVVPPDGVDTLLVGPLGAGCVIAACPHFVIAGVGPPFGAPLPLLATAFIEPPQRAIVAAEPVEVSIILRPKADWGSDSYTSPQQLFLQAHAARGPAVAAVAASLVDAEAGRYEGMITLPSAGQYVLEAATTVDAMAADVFASSLITVNVMGNADVGARPSSGAADSDKLSPLVPFVLVAIAALLLGGLIVLVRRQN